MHFFVVNLCFSVVSVFRRFKVCVCLRVGLIRLVEKHHAQMIYTRATKAGAAADE